jgi:hypothetical protein
LLEEFDRLSDRSFSARCPFELRSFAEMVHEQRDIFRPLPKRGHFEGNDRQGGSKIFAELPALDEIL